MGIGSLAKITNVKVVTIRYYEQIGLLGVLGTTPITFPIEWRNPRIPGYARGAVLTDVKGL